MSRGSDQETPDLIAAVTLILYSTEVGDLLLKVICLAGRPDDQ